MKAINLFLQTANSLYGPITTLRQNGKITKKIPWTAFTLTSGKRGLDLEKPGETQVALGISRDIKDTKDTKYPRFSQIGRAHV